MMPLARAVQCTVAVPLPLAVQWASGTVTPSRTLSVRRLAVPVPLSDSDCASAAYSATVTGTTSSCGFELTVLEP
jgi:hypothetical protein